MSRRTTIRPTRVPGGLHKDTVRETHPAFAMLSVHRGSYGGVGVQLVDSAINHSETITIRLEEAERNRDLKRDWFFGMEIITEVEMSMAQWASFVSSMNTTGVPVTLRLTRGEDGTLVKVPGLEEESRLAVTMGEAKDAAKVAFEHIKEHADEIDRLLDEKKGVREIREALTNLKFAIQNSVPNVDYATRTLADHAESVVQKARADVEAMVSQHAARLGLDAGLIQPLSLAGDERKELEDPNP